MPTDPAPAQIAANWIRPLQAIRALRALARSGGQDRPQGVAFLRATAGNSARIAFERFCSAPGGPTILRRQKSLRDHLLDRDGLAGMPAGSLGRAYLAFMRSENISMEHLLELAASHPEAAVSSEECRFAERTHAMHDLWHVVTGYGTDGAGEVCLLAMRGAQMRHIGVWMLVLFGMMKIGRELGRQRVYLAVREAYARGRRAEWLYGVDWEAMLPRPLEQVKETLRLAPPQHYPIMTSWRRMAPPRKAWRRLGWPVNNGR